MKRLVVLIRVGGILTALLGAGVAILTSGIGSRALSSPDDDRDGGKP